jgi:hypothetical protein
MSLITACAIFCSLKFHVVYTIMYFNLPPDKSENDQDMVTPIDLHIVQFDIRLLTLLFSLRYLSESCFGNDNVFHLPNLLLTQNVVYPILLSSLGFGFMKCRRSINT